MYLDRLLPKHGNHFCNYHLSYTYSDWYMTTAFTFTLWEALLTFRTTRLYSSSLYEVLIAPRTGPLAADVDFVLSSTVRV